MTERTAKPEFQRQERYLVFKVSHLTNEARKELNSLHIKYGLKKDCVVVESDWPEYEPTWQAIENRVTQK